MTLIKKFTVQSTNLPTLGKFPQELLGPKDPMGIINTPFGGKIQKPSNSLPPLGTFPESLLGPKDFGGIIQTPFGGSIPKNLSIQNPYYF